MENLKNCVFFDCALGGQMWFQNFNNFDQILVGKQGRFAAQFCSLHHHCVIRVSHLSVNVVYEIFYFWRVIIN